MSESTLEFHAPLEPWVASEGLVAGVWARLPAEDPDMGFEFPVVVYSWPTL
jgi:hypothetical protein